MTHTWYTRSISRLKSQVADLSIRVYQDRITGFAHSPKSVEDRKCSQVSALPSETKDPWLLRLCVAVLLSPALSSIYRVWTPLMNHLTSPHPTLPLLYPLPGGHRYRCYLAGRLLLWPTWTHWRGRTDPPVWLFFIHLEQGYGPSDTADLFCCLVPARWPSLVPQWQARWRCSIRFCTSSINLLWNLSCTVNNMGYISIYLSPWCHFPKHFHGHQGDQHLKYWHWLWLLSYIIWFPWTSFRKIRIMSW